MNTGCCEKINFCRSKSVGVQNPDSSHYCLLKLFCVWPTFIGQIMFKLLSILFLKSSQHWTVSSFPDNIYLFRFKNGNTRTTCSVCWNLTKKTRERCHSGVFIVNFKQISNIVLLFQFLILNKKMLVGFTIRQYSSLLNSKN